MDSTILVPIKGNWNKTNIHGCVPVSVTRMAEIGAYETPSRAGEYRFEAPTYLSPDGTLKAMEWCGECGNWKHREAFYKDRTRPRGLEKKCRQCSNPKAANRMRNYRARQKAARIAA